MSNLFLPVGGSMIAAPREKIDVPAPEIPPKLQADFDANPHLIEVFHTAISKALNASLKDPETSIRVVSAEALEERIQMLYRAFEILRFDLKFAMRKILDLLPDKFIEALKTGKRIEDLFEQNEGDSKTWARQGTQQRVEVPLSDDEDFTRQLEELPDSALEIEDED